MTPDSMLSRIVSVCRAGRRGGTSSHAAAGAGHAPAAVADDEDDIRHRHRRARPAGRGAGHPAFPLDLVRRPVHAAVRQPTARRAARRTRPEPAERRGAARRCSASSRHSMAANLPLRPQDKYFVGLDFASNIDADSWRACAAQPDRGGRPLRLDGRRADRAGQAGPAPGRSGRWAPATAWAS